MLFFPFGKIETFPSKSGFSRKESTFQVGFKLLKPTANSWFPHNIWQVSGSIGIVRRKPRLEKGECCFSLKTTIEAGFLLLGGVYFASRKFKTSCFFVILSLLLGADCHTYVLLWPLWEKAKFSYQKKASPERIIFCSGFQATEAICKNLVLTEFLS